VLPIPILDNTFFTIAIKVLSKAKNNVVSVPLFLWVEAFRVVYFINRLHFFSL